MKKITLLIIVLISKTSFAQNTFFSFYDTIPSSIWGTTHFASAILESYDGSFMEWAAGQDSIMILSKISTTGTLVWSKEISFPYHISQAGGTKLSDSTFIFMIFPFSPIYSNILVKADTSGNVLWIKGISKINNSNFTTIASTPDKGFVLAGRGCYNSNIIVRFDGNGNILSQHAYTSSSMLNVQVFDMIHDGNNQYVYCGNAMGISTGMNANPFTFFRTDSSSNVLNYKEYYIPEGFGTNYYQSKLIERAVNGGHYCIFNLSDSVGYKKLALMYFDVQDQLTWSKFIETTDTSMIPSSLLSTADGGCMVITTNTSKTFQKRYPVAMKFNNSGAFEWGKLLGDSTQFFWKFTEIRSVVSTKDNGWVAAVTRNSSFNIGKVDSLFDGFCNSHSFTPVLTNFAPQAYAFSLTPYAINFTISNLAPAIRNLPVYTFNQCFTLSRPDAELGTQLLQIYPNPTADYFIVKNHSAFSISFYLINSIGQQVEKMFLAGNESHFYSSRNLKNGIYFWRAVDENKYTASGKIVITK